MIESALLACHSASTHGTVLASHTPACPISGCPRRRPPTTGHAACFSSPRHSLSCPSSIGRRSCCLLLRRTSTRFDPMPLQKAVEILGAVPDRAADLDERWPATVPATLTEPCDRQVEIPRRVALADDVLWCDLSHGQVPASSLVLDRVSRRGVAEKWGGFSSSADGVSTPLVPRWA